ncbi:ArsR/SmtB family transcription factor [Aestuariivirga litoralis]|uniref:ArsR/SmtB family transcription factor n=1 Tax=Aestuariivirga litoralis TaxID=2650924 RepID=UPI0018C4E094|nr:helix-turn-helix domain-containing protein [Aestuariivirga litoralis]
MDRKITNLAGVFGSLGQGTRLEILRLLAPVSHGKAPAGMPAGQIAVALAVSPPTLSFHLKDMSLRHLLLPKRRGREIHYSANLPLILSALGDLVTELEA